MGHLSSHGHNRQGDRLLLRLATKYTAAAVEMMPLLFRAGVSPNLSIPAPDGSVTVLAYVARLGYREFVRELLLAGADVTLKDYDAVWRCIGVRCPRTLGLLLHRGGAGAFREDMLPRLMRVIRGPLGTLAIAPLLIEYLPPTPSAADALEEAMLSLTHHNYGGPCIREYGTHVGNAFLLWCYTHLPREASAEVRLQELARIVDGRTFRMKRILTEPYASQCLMAWHGCGAFRLETGLCPRARLLLSAAGLPVHEVQDWPHRRLSALSDLLAVMGVGRPQSVVLLYLQREEGSG